MERDNFYFCDPHGITKVVTPKEAIPILREMSEGGLKGYTLTLTDENNNFSVERKLFSPVTN